MKKKIFMSTLMLALFIIVISSYSFATTTNAMNTAKDSVMNVGNAIGNGVKDIGNGVANLGKDTINTTTNLGDSTANALGTTTRSDLNTMNGNYVATRTATTSADYMGLSSSTWTWLILGIIGIVIIALVWYYGAQYEHRNYDNN